jgi:hypothetical protein
MIGIYLVGLEGLNYIKIGVSRDVQQRVRDMQTSLPFGIVVHAFEYTPYAAELEQQLHKRLAPYHVRGEWFELPIDEAVQTYNEFLMMARVDEAMGDSAVTDNHDDDGVFLFVQNTPSLTLGQRIVALLSDGEGRDSLSIADAIGEPSAAVQAALSRLASAGKLTRSGGPRGYVYGKCMTRDDVIAKLRELRNSGMSRGEARTTLKGYGIEFENSLWTQAGGEL